MPPMPEQEPLNQPRSKTDLFVSFTLLGFFAAFAGMAGSGGITVNGTLVEGWRGVWLVTLACAVAGLLFGCVWLLIFKALREASKG